VISEEPRPNDEPNLYVVCRATRKHKMRFVVLRGGPSLTTESDKQHDPT
jgi:hypothetical protein